MTSLPDPDHTRPDGAQPDPSDDPILRLQEQFFIYVKVPVTHRRDDNEHRRDEALDAVLQQHHLGTVLGWGSSLGPALANGVRPVAFHRIDMVVNDVAKARQHLQQALLSEAHSSAEAAAALQGSEIHYTLNHVELQDTLENLQWQLGQPRRVSASPGRHNPS